MLYRRRAFTIVEVIIVVLIISIVAAILFPVVSRSSEGARQTSCSSNLRQIYAALNIYASDCDWTEGLALMRANPYSMKSYLKSDDVWYCPDLPASLRNVGYGSSYQFRFIMQPSRGPAISDEQWQLLMKYHEKELAEYKRRGNDYPLLVCYVHDELYYQPHEKHLDSKLVGAFVIELRENGSVYKGRMPYRREQLIKRMQDSIRRNAG